MSVLIDSSMLIAFLLRRDKRHSQASRVLPPLLDGQEGPPCITDYIVDEVLTYIVNRGATRSHLDKTIALLIGSGEAPGPMALHTIAPDHFAEAVRLVRRHRERRLSFTDCTSIALMEAAGIRAIATFDGGFDGLVARIAAP